MRTARLASQQPSCGALSCNGRPVVQPVALRGMAPRPVRLTPSTSGRLHAQPPGAIAAPTPLGNASSSSGSEMFPADQPAHVVCEYEHPGDLGFHRTTVDDQVHFITSELELSDEQIAYLLYKLGLDGEQDADAQAEAAAAAAQVMDGHHGHDDYSSESSVDDYQAEEHDDADHGYVPPVMEGDMANLLSLRTTLLNPSLESALNEAQAETQAELAQASANDLERVQAFESAGPSMTHAAYDPAYFDQAYEVVTLRVIGKRDSTSAAMGLEIELAPGRLIAGRYQVLEQLGAAAFSRVVQVYDIKEGRLMCLKVVKNDKESLDACLEEIRLLQMVNSRDPHDTAGIIRLYDYFYYLGHLFLVVELLGGSLYDTQRQDPTYFTAPRIQAVARQTLRSLNFLHHQGIIHADIKPENILVRNYSDCTTKIIDLGCSIYRHETRLSSYVQSRSYRAPEVMMGLPYDDRIDMWSLGCVLAEMVTGELLFPSARYVQRDGEQVVEQITEAQMLSRMSGMLGGLPKWMVREGSAAGAFFTRSGLPYERCPETGLFQVLHPKRTSLSSRVPGIDRSMLHFISMLLNPDPIKRPTAEQALRHPWLSHKYSSHVHHGLSNV